MEESFSVFDPISVKIDPEKVIEQLGYSHADCVSPELSKRLGQETAQALRLIEPKGAYVVLDRSQRRGLELFARAERIVLALATIGPAVELKARKLVQMQQSTRGVILDGDCSCRAYGRFYRK